MSSRMSRYCIVMLAFGSNNTCRRDRYTLIEHTPDDVETFVICVRGVDHSHRKLSGEIRMLYVESSPPSAGSPAH